jgi:hypothetical protein
MVEISGTAKPTGGGPVASPVAAPKPLMPGVNKPNGPLPASGQPVVARTASAPAGAQPSQAAKTAAKEADSTVSPVRAGPIFQIRENVSAGIQVPRLNGLVYGEYGAGKTFLMGTAVDVPCMRDVAVISAEGGTLTLDPDDPDHDFGLIDILRTTTYRQIARTYDFFKAHCYIRDLEGISETEKDQKLWALQKQVMPELAADGRIRRYQTVIMDSLTEAEQYCMMQLLGVNDATKVDEEIQGAEWAEYKKQHTMVQRLIRNFRDLPLHVLFTSARAQVQDESKRLVFSPMMTGKLSGQVQGFMDMVGYLIMGQAADENSLPPRRMYISPTTKYAAKARFSKYKKPFFDNPTIGSIMVDVGYLEASQCPRLIRPRKTTTTAA